MKVLNEREKKLRQIAMMNLNVGGKVEKEAAKKFLKDIGLSDESIKKLEGKKKEKVEEEVKEVEDEKKKKKCGCGNVVESLNEEHVIRGINDEKQAQDMLKKKGIVFNKINRMNDRVSFVFNKDGKNLNIGFYVPSKSELVITESLNEECDCENCPKEKHDKCNKPTKKCKKHKDMMGEEEIKDKINSVDMAQGALKAKNINWNKTEKVGNKTVWKNGDTIVGAWDPSWGTVRTGEDLLK